MSLEITAPQYVQFLKDTKWYAHADEGNAMELGYLMLGLAGEAGETADAFKKVIRECGFDNFEGFIQLMNEGESRKILDEMGDVLWYLTNLCTFFGTDLEALMLANTYKLHTRLIENEIIPEDKLQWPFTDPFKSKDNIKEALERGVHDVCID